MEYFDTHCHLDCPEFDHDREQVIANCDRLGVTHLLIPAIAASNWDDVLKTAALKESYYPALGMHPVYIEDHIPQHLEQLEDYVERFKPVAIGEIGLDFFVNGLDRARQLAMFEAQLDLAKRKDLPVVLHVRKAHDDVLKLLRRKKLRGGFVHAFSGSEQQAQQYIDLGFLLGFGGTLSYDRAQKLRRLVTTLPLEHIAFETDAPDIAPANHRGERNSPEYLTDTVQLVANLRGVSIDELLETTNQNVKNLLRV
ncbi:MAG: TatD family hydrolase [Gammaproteobacteria bacterium]|nr:TatD family hydrolase [Gammaproteobacteria bacterium]